ncbi:MAG TPA: STAS domain-containing protein [Solirubrobacteraceae bacterium]|nr:STAS domain-containing protein [Solirubrobacteraceae bacterium]
MVRPTRFEVAEATQSATLVLSIAGELDLNTATELARRVEDGLGRGASRVTLDLSALTFMDSSGLRLLIELDQRAGRDSWELGLIAPKHESASAVLRLTGADLALPFEGPV